MSNLSRMPIMILLLCILFFCLGISTLTFSPLNHRAISAPIPRQGLQKLNETVQNTQALSAIVYDMKNGSIVASKNPQVIMSLASLTKIFTAGLAYETFLQSHTPQSIQTRLFLKQIQHMMTASDNDKAETIATTFGSTRTLQLKQLHAYVLPYDITFKNVTGLDVSGQQVGAEGRAVDLALAIERVYRKYPEIFDTTIVPYWHNTNHAAAGLDFFVAGKTGFTHLTGGNLMVIVQKGISQKYMVLILGSTENGRFVDVEAIAKSLLQLDI